MISLTPEETVQVESAVDAFLESPNVQSTITNLITSGEKTGVAAIDTVIEDAKAGGIAGALVNAFKGSAEAEVNTLVASLPPASISMLATKAVENGLKSLLGA